MEGRRLITKLQLAWRKFWVCMVTPVIICFSFHHAEIKSVVIVKKQYVFKDIIQTGNVYIF